MSKVKSKKRNTKIETMIAVKSMVEFIKDEVDKAIINLSETEKINTGDAQSVSNVIKMSIDSAFIKASSQVEKTIKWKKVLNI